MTMRNAWPLLALSLAACGQERPQPIAALPELRQCPAYPLPPANLLKAPVKTDFLIG